MFFFSFHSKMVNTILFRKTIKSTFNEKIVSKVFFGRISSGELLTAIILFKWIVGWFILAIKTMYFFYYIKRRSTLNKLNFVRIVLPYVGVFRIYCCCFMHRLRNLSSIIRTYSKKPKNQYINAFNWNHAKSIKKN